MDIKKSKHLQKRCNKIEQVMCSNHWIKTTGKPAHKSTSNVSLIDLFCGCGGLTLGVIEGAKSHNLGVEIKLAVDISQEVIETYKHNFQPKNENLKCIDIQELIPTSPGEQLTNSENKLKNKLQNVDILVAGPPCQGHSDLNNNTRRFDPRNNLYTKVIRFAEIIRPKIVIVENVATVTLDKTKVVENSEEFLKHSGYQTKSIHINTANLGLPQTRKRHVLIGVLTNRKDILDTLETKQTDEQTPLSAYLDDIINEYKTKKGIFYTPSKMTDKNKQRANYLFDNDLYNLPNSQRPPCHKNKQHSYVSMYGRLWWDRPAQTLTCGFGSIGQGRFIHPLQPRVITPHEAARIQGFPDFFDFSPMKLRRTLQEAIGNAVPPILAATLLNKLLPQILS